MQGLLRELLSLCPADAPERQATVLRAVGASLSERSMHEDAAVAFVAAGDLRAALQSYRAGGCWRMVLALAGKPLVGGLCVSLAGADSTGQCRTSDLCCGLGSSS